ncbi:MAG: hypothetical protein UHO61_07810 [Acutalibacteraceae bacterium]|nr:hypothetical protein [Acutalibacteraceae bacterium]
MKKIFCFVLALTMITSFAACGKEKKEETAKVDIEYYAKLGEIPECDFKLGEDPENIKNTLSSEEQSAVSAGEEYAYNVTEGEKSVRIDNGDFSYFYEKEKSAAGISYIVSFDKAYGFETGASVLDVKDALTGFSCTEEVADDNNVFFLMGTENGSVLKYTFDDTVIIFVFQENELFATAIYSIDNWTI